MDVPICSTRFLSLVLRRLVLVIVSSSLKSFAWFHTDLEIIMVKYWNSILFLQKCSSLCGCGARNTSIMSSSRSPLTALGRRGTPTSTTARGNRGTTHCRIFINWTVPLVAEPWPVLGARASNLGVSIHTGEYKLNVSSLSFRNRVSLFTPSPP